MKKFEHFLRFLMSAGGARFQHLAIATIPAVMGTGKNNHPGKTYLQERILFLYPQSLLFKVCQKSKKSKCFRSLEKYLISTVLTEIYP